MTAGGKNLLILGLSAIVISVIASSVSLLLYHNSGDIYLDRSRPGFLPDKSEIDDRRAGEEYHFPDSGPLTKETINTYSDHLTAEFEALQKIEKPFDESALSDETLGLPSSN